MPQRWPRRHGAKTRLCPAYMLRLLSYPSVHGRRQPMEPPMRTRIVQALVATLALAATLNANAASAEGLAREGPFKILSFDELMKGQIIRSIPLRVSVPGDYEGLVLDPGVNGVVWARPEEFEAIRQTKALPSKTGYFFGRLTLNVGYDASIRSFICGPNCDEQALRQQVRDAADDARIRTTYRQRHTDPADRARRRQQAQDRRRRHPDVHGLHRHAHRYQRGVDLVSAAVAKPGSGPRRVGGVQAGAGRIELARST